ncbi:MAG: hypothetical protein LBR39_01915, partial [Coriobacteriales bacterium]|nr:hypothetical protein [Coriobacteriales bacterium]
MEKKVAPIPRAARLVLALLLVLALSPGLTLAVSNKAIADEPEATGWNVAYTAPGSGVVATIVVADDATSVALTMQKSSQWSADGNGWSSATLTLQPGGVYYLYTPLTGFISGRTAVLPNIKADVTVDLDPDVTVIGNFFMQAYGRNCTLLTSLGVPDTSNVTTVGNEFMDQYAYGCTFETLDVPDTSNMTSVGDGFMSAYARNVNLTALEVPDTSKMETVGTFFLFQYAYGCTSLITLALPDTTNITAADSTFMQYFAMSCNSLDFLTANSAPGLLATLDADWQIPAAAMADDEGLYVVVPANELEAWQALTAPGKMLALNQISDSSFVIAEGEDNGGNNNGGGIGDEDIDLAISSEEELLAFA